MELLPCPFCGGEALPTAHLTYNWFAPVCRRCNARGPSVKIERDSDPQEMRNLMNQADENWNRRASPASVPAGQALWDSVYKTLRGYRMTMMVDSEGDGYPLIDAMSPEHGTVTSGIEECTYLADAIYNELVAAAPTTPVQGDRKDAEILEQCRINGMGAEREATLLGKVERQSAALKLAREALFDMQDSYAAVHGWKDSFVIAATTAIAAIDSLQKGE